jgi:alpha-glucosidase
MARGLMDVVRGLRFMGFASVVASLRYSIIRDRLNARLLQEKRTSEAQPVGELLSARSSANGAIFEFEHAQLEVTFLAPDVIRCTWMPGEQPVPYAIEDFAWPGDKVALSEVADTHVIVGSKHRLELGASGRLRYCTSSGTILRQDGIPSVRDSSWALDSELTSEAVVVGLGERAAGLDLRGGTYRFWNLDPGGSYGANHDPLYLSIPVYYVLQHAGGYLLFHENTHDGSIELAEGIHVHFEGGVLRSYWMPGGPAHALARFSDLTGRAPLPPRWALGYHQSRWGYRTADEIRALIEGFEEHDLPLTAVHLDLDYMDGKRVFTFDQDRFPRIENLASSLLEKDIRLVTIIDPGVKIERSYPVYSSGLEQDVFCRRKDDRLLQAPVWPGWCVFPDFSSTAARVWWGEQYPRLLDAGIAGVWHDMNEPAAFSAWGELTLPLETQHALEGQRGDHRSGHNLYGLLMNRAGYEALRQLRPQRRPFLLTRSGWAGVQRYAWAWSGDTESSWEMLHHTIGTLLGMGMSGLPFIGSDIGGFSGKPDAELFLRWLQLAAFTPFFRTHSALGTERREPWAFGDDTLEAARRTLKLRQRLMPYLYTQSWVSCRRGIPLMRPAFWADPRDETLWPLDDQFMLGDALLVAPVLVSGAAERQVRLPNGPWIDFYSGQTQQGPCVITLPTEPDRIPLLVRGGALLPLNDHGMLTLRLHLPGPDGEAGLHYLDDGDGYGESRIDRYELVSRTDRVQLRCETQGGYPPPDRIRFELIGGETTSLAADGSQIEKSPQGFILPPFQELEIDIG